MIPDSGQDVNLPVPLTVVRFVLQAVRITAQQAATQPALETVNPVVHYPAGIPVPIIATPPVRRPVVQPVPELVH